MPLNVNILHLEIYLGMRFIYSR